MRNICGTLLLILVAFSLKAQTENLPSDFRQQNLTEYNSSLLNPAYSLDRNNPPSLAVWTRWQWQIVDADPTSLFVNYTANLNKNSAVGVGFFQNNTGIFLKSGVALNYAYELDLGDKVSLGMGLNLFVYQQALADQRFFVPNPIQTSITNDFVMQMAPGINLRIDRLNLGITSENLFDFNISTNDFNSASDNKTFQALASYDIPVSFLNEDLSPMLRPAVYYKSVPGFDSQFGIMSILTTNKFWAQAGYNSFYGFSGGVGGRFFKRFSIGALIEVGTSADLNGQEPSFEFVTSYKLGSKKTAEEELEEQLLAEEENKEALETDEELFTEELTKVEKLALKREAQKQREIEKVAAKQVKDSIQLANKLEKERSDKLAQEDQIDAELVDEELSKKEKLAAKEQAKKQKQLESLAARRAKDSIALVERDLKIAEAKAEKEVKAKEDALKEAAAQEVIAKAKKREQDSLRIAEKARAEMVAKEEERKQEAIAAAEKERLEQEAIIAQQKEVVKPKAGEKYEEVSKQGALAPGYYLIANVFGTKKYFEAFMIDMKKKGLNPGSFYRSVNNYNYVYLGKYNSIKEARTARDSKLNGTYKEKLWIFRVTGE